MQSSKTETVPKQAFDVWTEGLTGMLFVPAQHLSGIVWRGPKTVEVVNKYLHTSSSIGAISINVFNLKMNEREEKNQELTCLKVATTRKLVSNQF